MKSALTTTALAEAIIASQVKDLHEETEPAVSEADTEGKGLLEDLDVESYVDDLF